MACPVFTVHASGYFLGIAKRVAVLILCTGPLAPRASPARGCPAADGIKSTFFVNRLGSFPLSQTYVLYRRMMRGEVYALDRGSDISLVATCHDMIWTATELELQQIHEYLVVLMGGSD